MLNPVGQRRLSKLTEGIRLRDEEGNYIVENGEYRYKNDKAEGDLLYGRHMAAVLKVDLDAAIRSGIEACKKCECIETGSVSGEGRYRITVDCHDDVKKYLSGKILWYVKTGKMFGSKRWVYCV
tara:strand:- start:3118 stop:3489 length:372 start_codon:yes stop_codon:yes gene_type:complete